jgi:hypothetical protein
VDDFNDISAFQEADVGFFGKARVFEKNELSPGQIFASRAELKKKISEFHVSKNIECRWEKSEPGRMIVKCKDNCCDFRLFAKPQGIGDAWVIKKCHVPHSCRTPASRTDHAQLTASIIADVIADTIKRDVASSINHIADVVRTKFSMVIPKYNKLWRGRELAIARLFGSWEGSYSLLEPILEAIRRTNPGTKYQVLTKNIGVDGARQFKAVIWAYGPCIAAIPFLRPVISIDACFMSGRYAGRLLMACGYDAENQLLPLAFAIVEKENSDNWGFFMKWLRREVIGMDRYMCVISDRHKAIKWVFEQSHLGWNVENGECMHRLCMQHVTENLYNHCGRDEEISNRFKAGCRKNKPRRLIEMFKDFEKYCPKAVAYLNKVGKKNPSDEEEMPKHEKVFACSDGGFRWGIMTTNGSESLNNVFRQSRKLPVAAIVEDTFYKCNAWFVKRREQAARLLQSGQRWSTRVEGKLAKHVEKGSKMTVVPYAYEHGEYEVLVKGEYVPHERGDDGRMNYTRQDFGYNVIIKPDRTVECACQKIQFTGIPCSHVMAVCRERNFDENEYVSSYYSSQYLASTWGEFFHPKGNQCEWPPYDGPRILPERRLIRVGRRKQNRIPMGMDGMQGRRLGHQASRATTDRQAAGTW